MNPLRQKIRLCYSRDGVGLAYALTGSGPPLVKAANYLTHLEYDWPVWQHWLEAFSAEHQLLRYDERGSGLSDRTVHQHSIDAWVEDLHAVTMAADYQCFPVLGISQGASVAIAYAARYPERVSHLILYGGYARGRFHRAKTPEQREEADTIINVIRLGWGKANPVFRQLYSTMLMPGGNVQQQHQLNELARVSASAEGAARMVEAFFNINVEPLAKRLRVPTLVVHARNDMCVEFEEGRRLAALIPEAEFMPLQSENHILLAGESAFSEFTAKVWDFLGVDNGHKALPPGWTELTKRELGVLEAIAKGLSNIQIAGQLNITEKTVRNHITHLYGKLGVNRRAEAIILAREKGLGNAE